MAKAGDGKRRSGTRRTDAQVSKRLTHKQIAELDIRAAENGFADRQAYLTAFLVGELEIEGALRKSAITALGHVGKIGSNLNQIARAINLGAIKGLSDSDIETIKSVRDSVENVGAEIREALK
jgi:hypothetical protein